MTYLQQSISTLWYSYFYFSKRSKYFLRHCGNFDYFQKATFIFHLMTMYVKNQCLDFYEFCEYSCPEIMKLWVLMFWWPLDLYYQTIVQYRWNGSCFGVLVNRLKHILYWNCNIVKFIFWFIMIRNYKHNVVTSLYMFYWYIVICTYQAAHTWELFDVTESATDSFWPSFQGVVT